MMELGRRSDYVQASRLVPMPEPILRQVRGSDGCPVRAIRGLVRRDQTLVLGVPIPGASDEWLYDCGQSLGEARLGIYAAERKQVAPSDISWYLLDRSVYGR